MSGKTIPSLPEAPIKRPNETDKPAMEPLLIDIKELSRLTSLSVRTLRRMDAAQEIPGRVTKGRAVRFRTDLIKEWVRSGLSDRANWEPVTSSGKR